MKAIRKALLICLALGLAGLWGCKAEAPKAACSDMPLEETVTAAPEEEPAGLGAFTTKDTAGNPVTEEIFSEANVTMLNVWATFCGYCIQEMPELTRLNKAYADEGFQVIGLVGDVGDGKGGFSDQDRNEAQAILDKAGAAFPTLMPSAELIDSVLSQVSAYPTTFFVDSSGKLLGKPVLGAMGEEFWRGAIEAYLKAASKKEASADQPIRAMQTAEEILSGTGETYLPGAPACEDCG